MEQHEMEVASMGCRERIERRGEKLINLKHSVGVLGEAVGELSASPHDPHRQTGVKAKELKRYHLRQPPVRAGVR